MNNYISLDLVSGRLSRMAGGGKPIFILGEQNDVQIYLLDYPKPAIYPSNALGDAFSYALESRDFNATNVTIKAGERGSSAIINTSSFLNLPNTVQIFSTQNVDYSTINSNQRFLFTGTFKYGGTPIYGSTFRLSTTFTPNVGSQIQNNSLPFSYETSIIDLKEIIKNNFVDLFRRMDSYFFTWSSDPVTYVTQLTEYEYSYSVEMLASNTNAPADDPSRYTTSFQNLNSSLNYGKYGNLDFSSPSWDSIIGTNNEVEIWMEAMINNETISKGKALLLNKLT